MSDKGNIKIKDQTTLKEKLSYSIGTLGKEISFGMINVYSMLYLTSFMGLNGIVVGFAFCIVRLLAAIFDPLMATIVNNTKSPLGKFRPWLLVGAIINSIILIVMFLPLPDGTGMPIKYVFYLAMYFLWAISYAIIDVPIMAMVPSIADTPHERESVSSLSRLIGGFGGFIIGSGGAILMQNSFGNTDYRSYLLVAGVGAIVLIVSLLLPIITLKERYVLPCQTVKFRDMFKMLKNNDQMRSFAWSYLLFTIGGNIAILQSTYLFIYDSANLGNFNNYALFNILACTVQGVAMIFYTWITKKISRDKVYKLTYLFAGIGMAFIFGIYFAFPGIGIPIVNVILLSIAGSSLMLANGMNQITSMVMITDVVDYGEYITGKRSDSLVISLQTLILKASAAFAMLILGIGVAVSDLPTIDLMTNTFTGEVTDKALFILRSFMFLLPLPLMPIGLIIYSRTYKLHGKYYSEIKKSIEERRIGKGFTQEEDSMPNEKIGG
jgi:melibiose permease